MVLNRIRRMSVLKPLSPVRESSVDILVVGADPCGLLSAIALAREGFSIRVIDQKPEKALASGMVSLAPQTIDILKVGCHVIMSIIT
jgi:ribulose 1,5-bisphosphate synthetase/thiazole synthase